MRRNLLNTKGTLIAASIALIIGGCGGGTDEGFSYGLAEGAPVEFSGPIAVSVNEWQGEYSGATDLSAATVSVDLTEGVTNGDPNVSLIVSGFEFTADDPNYPLEGVGVAAILVQGNTLKVNTGLFARSLELGESATYSYTYNILNGSSQPANTRNLSITVNGIAEPVTDFTISAGDAIKLPPGFPLALSANTFPAYASNTAVSWMVEDETVATVTAGGVLEGLTLGQTTNLIVTPLGNPALAITVPVTVTNDIEDPLAVQLVNAVNEEVENVTIGTCNNYIFTANLLPVAANFDRVINWSSSNAPAADVDMDGLVSIFIDGETLGSTAITAESGGLQDMVAFNIKQNAYCGTTIDSEFDTGNANSLQGRWRNIDGVFTTWAKAAGEGIVGNAGHLVTDVGDGTTKYSIRYTDFNNGRNPVTVALGENKATGKTFQSSVWVKVNSDSPVIMSHSYIPYTAADKFDALPIVDSEQTVGLNGGEWQLVELPSFEVPTGWDDDVMIIISLTPSAGVIDDIYIDNISLIEMP